jgi:thiol:disulfide interchange protein DsbA
MKFLLTALLTLISFTASADPQPGNEYMLTQQLIATDNPAKIEVVELFWYGCPHCHDLEPVLNPWVSKLPKDVVFKRVPGIPRPDWMTMAKAYYTMEALNVLEKLHAPLFATLHPKASFKANDDAATINWIAIQGGLDRKKVEETFNSFSVNTKVMRASQIFRASGATGVPTLLIDGKYITGPTLAGGGPEALKVADYLIDKARKEKGAK